MGIIEQDALTPTFSLVRVFYEMYLKSLWMTLLKNVIEPTNLAEYYLAV